MEVFIKKAITIIMVLFSIVSVIQIINVSNLTDVNAPRLFIIGALSYVLFFLLLCFSRLKEENLTFFTHHNFILLFSPVLFFIGFSLIFAFSNKKLNDTIIWGGINLFNLISYFINFTYYSLINFYIFKERKHL
jgi:hypothetical protein